jgi:hypothetical protein
LFNVLLLMDFLDIWQLNRVHTNFELETHLISSNLSHCFSRS